MWQETEWSKRLERFSAVTPAEDLSLWSGAPRLTEFSRAPPSAVPWVWIGAQVVLELPSEGIHHGSSQYVQPRSQEPRGAEELRNTTPSPELLRLPERPDASPSSARVCTERCRRSVRQLYVTK